MYRKIEEELKKWKNDYKMPLMLVGARQTGKTYILEEFCKDNFDNYVYINLDKEENIAEVFEETIDPEQTIDRALETYVKKGYRREWINQRLQAIQVRKELTDEWETHGVKKGIEYAILTDEITKAWSGMSTREYKNHKGLKKENLRDNMTATEIILNMLAETAAKNISQVENPETFEEYQSVAKRGGKIAGNARKELETEIGHSVISEKSAPELNTVVTNLIQNFSKE